MTYLITVPAMPGPAEVPKALESFAGMPDPAEAPAPPAEVA